MWLGFEKALIASRPPKSAVRNLWWVEEGRGRILAVRAWFSKVRERRGALGNPGILQHHRNKEDHDHRRGIEGRLEAPARTVRRMRMRLSP